MFTTATYCMTAKGVLSHYSIPVCAGIGPCRRLWELSPAWVDARTGTGTSRKPGVPRPLPSRKFPRHTRGWQAVPCMRRRDGYNRMHADDSEH